MVGLHVMEYDYYLVFYWFVSRPIDEEETFPYVLNHCVHRVAAVGA